MYFDAQVDDARYVLAVIRTAATYGARVLSRARVTSLIKDDGQIRGAQITIAGVSEESTFGRLR